MTDKLTGGVKVVIQEPSRKQEDKDKKSSNRKKGTELDERETSQRSLFDDPLPKWLVWPLDAKLPMISGPQKFQLYTTYLGEKVRLSQFYRD